MTALEEVSDHLLVPARKPNDKEAVTNPGLRLPSRQDTKHKKQESWEAKDS